jgi:hypothetical protein
MEIETTQLTERQFLKFVEKLRQLYDTADDHEFETLVQKFLAEAKKEGCRTMPLSSNEHGAEYQDLRNAASLALRRARGYDRQK